MISLRNNRFVELFLDALYLRHCTCPTCGREAALGEYGVCDDCRDSIATPATLENIEGIEAITAGFIYKDCIKQSIVDFKYNGKRYLADFLASQMHIDDTWAIDVIVPVPLHKRRIVQRGFNQSELLARRLSKRYSIDLDTGILKRIVYTKPQASLGARERGHNLDGAFVAKDSCKGKNILLVDDVFTTGATLRNCAIALNAAGASKTYAAVIATTVMNTTAHMYH